MVGTRKYNAVAAVESVTVDTAGLCLVVHGMGGSRDAFILTDTHVIISLLALVLYVFLRLCP